MGHPALEIPPREKTQDRPPIFVHSCIDDLDLSLEAFRVYSHLSRRWGDGTRDSVGSYSKIGEHCFRASFPCASKATLKRKTIAAIKELEEHGLIEKHKYKGYDGRDISNSYTLRTRDELCNVIPFPNPPKATHPPVQYHPIKGTTTKGSTTKKSHNAGEKNSESSSQNVEPAVTENPKPSEESNDCSTTNESNQGKSSAGVDEKVINLKQRRKTSLGDAPFESVSEMNEFQLALTEFAKATGKRNPGGFAQSILKEMRSTGYEHPYWQEWKQGSVIGTHEKQEWEALPGQPYPYFLEYLTGELKRNEYTEAQALQQANWICSNPQHAKPHWEKFKLKVEREAEEKGRLAENNVTYLPPKWARSETVSFEDAVTAVDKIQTDAPQLQAVESSETDDWINPVASVQNWLADIATKWTGIYRGLSQRFFSSAIFHASLDEQTEIYKLLLDNSFTKEWAKTLIAQETNYDF